MFQFYQTFDQQEQITVAIDDCQELVHQNKIPIIDARFWKCLEEVIALLQPFLSVNLMITPEMRPTLSTYAGSMELEMLKRMTKSDSHLVYRTDLGTAKEKVFSRKFPSAIDPAVLAVQKVLHTDLC